MIKVEHYKTFRSNNFLHSGKRIINLCSHGFKPTIYNFMSGEVDSPVQHAEGLATRMNHVNCNVHVVLLDNKNMDRNTGYQMFIKITPSIILPTAPKGE